MTDPDDLKQFTTEDEARIIQEPEIRAQERAEDELRRRGASPTGPPAGQQPPFCS